MTKFINITHSDQSPLIVDVENIAVLIDCIDEHQAGLYLSHAEQGRIKSFSANGTSVDADTIADQVRKAGVDFIKMPFFWSSQDMGHYYVNPAAVDTISVSKTFVKPDDNSEYVTLIASTQRGDTVETSYVPLNVAEELVEAIKRANPHMVNIPSEMARTNHVQGGFTLLDPSQIIAVRPNGDNELRVSFVSDTGLSLRIVEFDAIKKDNHKYLNDLFSRLRGDKSADEFAKTIGSLEDVLMPRIHRREKLYTKRLVDKFTAAVFDNVDGLVKVKDAAGVFYVRPDQILSIGKAGDTGIKVTFNKSAKEQFASDLCISYKDDLSAAKGMKNLLAQVQKP